MKYVIVTGDRYYKNVTAITNSLEAMREDLCVVHGACPSGADAIAERVCKEYMIPYHGYPAQWHRYHNGAGPIRNTLMLDLYPNAEIIAFHDHLEISRGTKNMIEQATERGRKVTLYSKGEVFEQLTID